MSNDDDRKAYWDIVASADRSHDPGASTDQRSQLEQLTARAGAGGPDGADARKMLEQVASGANTARLRELAAAALRSLAPKGPTPRGPASEALQIPDELRFPGGQ